MYVLTVLVRVLCACVVHAQFMTFTAFIRGTHNRYAGGGHVGENRPQDAMEGHVKFAGKAGDAMMFDIRTHHTAMPNTSQLERQSIIIRYSPFWLKNTGMREIGEAMEAQGKLEGRSAMCRQLLGMGMADGRHSPFEAEQIDGGIDR